MMIKVCQTEALKPLRQNIIIAGSVLIFGYLKYFDVLINKKSREYNKKLIWKLS